MGQLIYLYSILTKPEAHRLLKPVFRAHRLICVSVPPTSSRLCVKAAKDTVQQKESTLKAAVEEAEELRTRLYATTLKETESSQSVEVRPAPCALPPPHASSPLATRFHFCSQSWGKLQWYFLAVHVKATAPALCSGLTI